MPDRFALWLLRHGRIRVFAECPHGQFVPMTWRLDRGGRFGCEHCNFHVRAHYTKDPYGGGDHA